MSMLPVVDIGRDEASCAALARNQARIARRKQLLMTRWFIPWRVRKWMPDVVAPLRAALEREFDRRGRAALHRQWYDA